MTSIFVKDLRLLHFYNRPDLKITTDVDFKFSVASILQLARHEIDDGRQIYLRVGQT